MRIVPVVINKETGKVIDRGEMDERHFEVIESINWNLQLKGTIKVTDKINDMKNTVPVKENEDKVEGSVKIGLFKSDSWDKATQTHQLYLGFSK